MIEYQHGVCMTESVTGLRSIVVLLVTCICVFNYIMFLGGVFVSTCMEDESYLISLSVSLFEG
jgi:hypothetical protein